MRTLLVFLLALTTNRACAGLKTWDGRHSIDAIEVTVVYFVPKDRTPLPDWRKRVDYFCRRIELFHRREFQGQSTLRTIVQPEPMVSESDTAQLRRGDANGIFFRTLREVDKRLDFARGERTAFPILLVLSDVNWRPLDDFYRLRPEGEGLQFEGNYNDGEHFPGAASGGARATYLADRGVGWGLVSADGWRVPYRGSDCVIYHEGCGHTVGLPHPEQGNGSVMSLGQYHGWISESWLDNDQKARLGWEPKELPADPQLELFTRFRALPEPRVPKPDEEVRLALDWPPDAAVKSLRVRWQTELGGPWIEAVDLRPEQDAPPPKQLSLGKFDRPTPVSYRVDVTLDGDVSTELWGYFQVRATRRENPQPFVLSDDLRIVRAPSADAPTATAVSAPTKPRPEVDLLALADPKTCWKSAEWSRVDGRLESPRQYGARLEIPYEPPAEYRITLIVEPLDEPNGLLVGHRLGGQRFVTLCSFTPAETALSAIENVDGQNVGNDTTHEGALFQKNRLSQVIIDVHKAGVTMTVDGRRIVDWKGDAKRLSLSNYWRTPRENAMFLGAYDCRYRFYRVSLEPITGDGRVLTGPTGD